MQWTDWIRRRLKLRDLHVFMSVMEHGNLSKAAKALAISRPVVSKAISDLERTLGLQLLDRNPQGIEPTVFGQALHRRSVMIFDNLKQGMKELEFLADPRKGDLQIGCSEYMAAGFVPAVIDQLSHKHPQMQFHLELGDAASLQESALPQRKVEFAIARMLAPVVKPDMRAEVLFHERLFIAVGPGSKWADRRKINLAELVHERWMLAPPELAEGSPLIEAFRAERIPIPQPTVMALSLPLRNGLLATGKFLTVVPGSVMQFGAERTLLKALPVELPDWKLPVAIITLKNRALSPIAELFIEAAREMAKPLAERSKARGRRR
jgi:DNA-binding transcriptional LysR family regulator